MGAVYSYFKNHPQLNKTDQVFLNDLILHTILKHLSPKDLVVCRLVHSLWLREASKILKKGNYLNEIQIVPTIKSQLDAKLHSHADESNVLQWITLKEFLDILPHSRALLPFKFHMMPNRWEARNYFDDFILLHGKHITELSLTARMYDSIVMTTQRFAQFEILLVEQLPNLKIISLGKLPAEFNGAPLTFSKIGISPPKLKSLRTLNISPYCSEAMPLTWIINEAPNLVEIRNRTGKFSVNCLDVLLRLQKGHLIRDMRFDFLSESEVRAAGNEAGNLNLKLVELYAKLAEQQTMLKNITAISFAGADLEIMLPRLIRILNSWLESSSASLEIINAESSCALGSFPGLIFPPKLPKLTHLGLGLHASDPPRIFPELTMRRNEQNLNLLGDVNELLDLAGVFPNLDCLNLNFDGDVFLLLEPSQVFFEPLTRILSVTKLSFSTEHLVPSISMGWLTYLGKMFPNMKSLTLPRFRASSFVGASRNIWTWRYARWKLRELRLCILVDLNEDSNDIPPILDAAFTGLSVATCNYLIKSGLKGYTGDKLDPSSMRSDTSILALKSLKNLRVDFVGVQDQLPISEVSCKFGFDLCLNLETTFSIDNPRLLEKLELIVPNGKCEIMEY